MKMSKSEAGKLGAIKSMETCKLAKQKRVDEYNTNPRQCLECNVSIMYEKRHNKFCSQSCSAKYTNARKDWNNIVTGPTRLNEKKECIPRIKREPCACLNCGIEKKNLKKYCSVKCQKEFQKKQKIVDWKNGLHVGKNQIKRYLEEKYGYVCSVCGISEWQGKRIGLELEHKDGNSENNLEDNLCLICPNCHSQTDTYKAKNKGNGRHARRQRYKEGKSF